MSGRINETAANASSQTVYPTYGVHNPPKYSPCAGIDCLYARGPGEPSDPLLPLYWSAKWTMYRVFRQYSEYPPPYDGKPPAPMREGIDYQTSHGALTTTARGAARTVKRAQ